MAPPKKKKRRVHEELEGFDISINPLGELESSIDIDRLNAFLNRHGDDKRHGGDDEE